MEKYKKNFIKKILIEDKIPASCGSCLFYNSICLKYHFTNTSCQNSSCTEIFNFNHICGFLDKPCNSCEPICQILDFELKILEDF